MPAYDYRCTACDLLFEHTRPISDTSAVPCPVCVGSTKRVFTPVGVVFKGSGFHTTDYRPKPKSEESPAPAKDSCATSGTSAACATCPSAE